MDVPPHVGEEKIFCFSELDDSLMMRARKEV